jgi:hypothetical protein
MKYLYYNPNQNNSVSDSSSILTLARSIMFLFCLGLGISIYSQEVSIDFTSSGTWTVPAGVTQITVEAWGAGGGGGGSNSNNSGGSGGGGGGYSMKTFTVTQNQSISFTVGTGGSGGAENGGNGGNGGDTSILGVVANGGTGGGANGGTSGTGGSASGGDIIVNGANGGVGGNTGGNGGNGANGGAGGSGARNGAGQNGNSPGGGGGGGEKYSGNIFGWGAVNYPGGRGSDGLIRISYVPAYRAEFISMDTGDDIWEAGETRDISVTVMNTGQATWTNSEPDVNIGVKWDAESDYMVSVNADNLVPGETRTYYLTIKAPLSLGTNHLTFDVVAQGACKFGDNTNICGPGNTTFRSGNITIAPVIDRYYSYRSGNWEDPSTWTQDPSGTLSVNPKVPGEYDFVTVLNGREVKAIATNKRSYSLEIQNGGSLDIGSTTGHNFGTVSGEGTLRLQSTTFPGGDFSSFNSTGGGTVEFYNTSNFTIPGNQYNNLILNLSNNSIVATLAGDLTINGNLTINRGRFQIGNDASSRSILIRGNVLVETNGSIRLGTGNANHRILVGGDFTNYGSVRFTNQNEKFSDNFYTSTPYNGRADVVFNNPASDQNLYLAGQSDFYRIEIDKGVDQTYILNIDASATNHFRLYGRNNQEPGTNAPNIDNTHALGLLAGTVRLGQNIIIPCLATSTTYTVDEDAMLWLDGANVTFGTGNTGDGTTLLLYGALKVTGNSVLNDNSKQGIVLRTTASVTIEGGQITTECLRTSYQEGVHRGAFNMSGGELTIRGTDLPNLTGMNVYATFTLPYSSNTINITGGVINIKSPNPLTRGSGSNFSLLIGANPNNVSITGGEINITVPNRDTYLLSTAPLWNLNIVSTNNNRSAQPRAYANNSTIPGLAVQPLVVKNNLTLNNRAVLTSGNDNANVVVGGNFTINANTTYTPGNNTTIFNGNGPQTLSILGTIGNGFNNLELAGKSDLSLEGIGNVNIRNSLTIGEGTVLRDNGKIISVTGNISNSGTHFRPVTGGGRIELTGSRNQIISGNGNGAFNNLSINKTNGSVTVETDIFVSGDLRLVSNHRLDIGDNLLKLGPEAEIYSSATGTTKSFTNNKMILTSGLLSDNGLQKVFSSTSEFLFPFGFAINTNYYYLPASVQFTAAPAKWGAVTSRPVNGRHHLAQNNNALGLFWKTKSSDFEGVKAGSVVHKYTYANDFVNGTESNYIPAVYNYGTSWRTIADVNLVDNANNRITFNAENEANGDYTAGQTAAFAGIPVLYSRQTGNWNDASTWSSTGHTGGAASSTPAANTIVIIGNGHTLTIPVDNASAGALIISEGATLDLGNTRGHNFAALPEETVAGNGTLRIGRSNYFPRGDFGEFLGPDGGTVEYYTSTDNITVPSSNDGNTVKLTKYYNLVLNASAGTTITLPNTDFEVINNATIKGEGSVITRTGDSRNYKVNNNLIVESGTLSFQNNRATTISVLGNLEIENGTLSVTDANAAVDNVIEIHGNLVNNGTLNLSASNNRRVKTIFKGEKDAIIEGSGTTFKFYDITVDKGTDATPVLKLKSSISAEKSNPFLTLLNGTFQVDKEDLIVTITDGNTSFEVPPTAALSVKAGTMRVAYGNGSANLVLSGKLEVLGGRMEIGDENQNRNNSIEYTAAGKPEVYVEGGTLYVNGQIRRPTTTTSGSLNLIQKGGDIIIAGRARTATRGLLEIANSGSRLDLSGGVLYLKRPSTDGTTFGDLYLRPEVANATGGTIQLGYDGDNANYNFKLQSNAPLWNLRIGDNTGQTATLVVLPLAIKNELSISQNSVFSAAGFDVEISGRLVNSNASNSRGINEGGYRPGSLAQTTRFTGNGELAIKGVTTNVTNFANLEVSAQKLSLEENTSLFVNNKLNLYSGIFDDGGNIVSVAKNIQNNATHTSRYSSGGIYLEGDEVQVISGSNAVFGNLALNNGRGAFLTNNIRINGKLEFNAGSLYVNDYLLTFGENAYVSGSTNKSRMIILNGVLSDQGVRKMFPAGASTEFVFPIGVQDKFTPASYTILSNTKPGSITLRPINERHAAINDPAENELVYYWSVSSDGFEGLAVTHKYQYLEDDVKGNESMYVGGRYDYEAYTWTNLGNVINTSDNTISFTADYITGEYTAGYPENFITKPVLYSCTNGNWDSGTTWSLTPGGSPANTTPDGNPVVIAVGHTVTITSDNAYAYSVELHGTLNIGTTLYHNLGHFFGDGKLIVESTAQGNFVLPGGKFDDFFADENSTIEFNGNNEAYLPLKPGNIYKPFQNVILSGTGRKNISAGDLKINGNLVIRNGAILSNANYNRTLYIGGNWINENTVTGRFIPGRGTVVFDGDGVQKFNNKVSENFYNLTINTSGELDMSDAAAGANINISNKLTLTKGIIRTYDNKLVYITSTSTVAVNGGNNNAYVDGPLRKDILTGQSFTFPVGNDGRFGKIGILNTTGGSSPAAWTVRYFNKNDLPREEENLNSPVTSVSDNEYWSVSRPAGASANIKLRWDEQSYPGITTDATLRNRLRVVQFNNADNKWSERGQLINEGEKTVSTTSQVTTNDYLFTIGVIGVTASITDFSQVEICDNGEIASIPVALTGSAPWTLTYKVEGKINRTFTQTGITSPNYLIQISGDDLAGAGTYNISLVSVSDQSSNGTAHSGSVILNVNETFVPVITGASTVGINEVRTYSTPINGSNSYLWSWVDGVGGTIVSPNAASTNITFNKGIGNFKLQLTEVTASTGCQVSMIYEITVVDKPAPDISPKDQNICAGTTVTYSTVPNTGNTYKWTVTGGIVQTADYDTYRAVAQGGNTIIVKWDQAGSGTVKVEEQKSGVIGESILELVVSPKVNTRTVTLVDTEICNGSETFVRIQDSELNVSYRLKLTDGTYLNPSTGGTGADLLLPTGALYADKAPYNIVVEAFNLACSVDIPAGTVYVRPEINVSVSSDVTDNKFCIGTPVNFSATAGFISYIFEVDGKQYDNGSNPVFTTNALNNGSEVKVRVSNANGCDGTSASLIMTAADYSGIWTGIKDTEWTDPMNWCNGQVPINFDGIVISSKMVNKPVITGEYTLTNLTIQDGAQLWIDGGAKVNLEGSFTNNGELVLNNRYGVNGMVSLIDKSVISGSGTTRVRLTTPANQWFYLGSIRKNAIFSDFGAGQPGIVVSSYRQNKWWNIQTTLASRSLRLLEGIATNLIDDKVEKRLIEYTGEINKEEVSRVFEEKGFSLLGNPYPAFISWENSAAWERPNVDGTIWYRSKVGEEMAFITYNKDAAPFGKVALYPEQEIGTISEEELSLIPPMQAVWIKTFVEGVTVTVKPEGRTHGINGSILKSTSTSSADVIRIETSNAYSRDGAVIYFSEGSAEGLDKGDSEKYFNDSKRIPEIYTRSGAASLAINGLPTINKEIIEIPLSTRNQVAGEVEMKFDISHFNSNHAILLEDRYNGTVVNLRSQNTYSYIAEAIGDNHDRFVLKLHNITTNTDVIKDDEVNAGNEIQIRNAGSMILVTASMNLISQGPGVIEIFTVEGRKLQEVPAHSSRTLILMPKESGVYIVRARFGNTVKSERLLGKGHFDEYIE